MEEHCEDLKDEEIAIGLSDKNTDLTKEPKRRAAAKPKTKKKGKSTSNEGQGSPESAVTDSDLESKKWKPQSIPTDWGRTDDVITIGNGDQYYFFKIPHKVRQFNTMQIDDVMMM